MPNRFSRPASTSPLGKCVESVKTTIPEETHRLLRMHAAAAGATEAEVVRNMLIEKAYAEGDRAAAVRWSNERTEAIKARSPAQVARMEQEKGLV